ncbi:hypothetical protein EFA46_007710 [Halarchaeum sp. CBA1220]|uniref:hypothetical protein n=1 Tax=Halarchaeum sp. CBA1220 TaxID=1853682 RepID=UPI000F3A9A36|nr:hypothetical protein [Halarchaeum sp. CBA1220]QLC34092.1 hypothetical protein EFA46_007710 [Halarchaeum sp. CBA1220]
MSDEHPLDAAQSANIDINDRLAETDGTITAMEFSGRIGYHINVATGVTDPESLWRVALFQALDETLLEQMWIDGDTPADARRGVERELEDAMTPWMAETIADRFEAKLESLIDAQEEVDA